MKPLRDALKFFKSAHLQEEIPMDIDPELMKAYEIIDVEHIK